MIDIQFHHIRVLRRLIVNVPISQGRIITVINLEDMLIYISHL